jgi:hypothetical protein
MDSIPQPPAGRDADPDVAQPSSQADSDWYSSRLQEISRQYPDAWLAIYGQRVAASAPTTEELREKLVRLGLPRALIVRSHPEAWNRLK